MSVYRKLLLLDDGRQVTFEKCLLATGGTPKNLPVLEDKSLEDNVVLFRTTRDFERLTKAVKPGARLLVVGGGFLGSELAVALAQRKKDVDCNVTQVFPEKGAQRYCTANARSSCPLRARVTRRHS